MTEPTETDITNEVELLYNALKGCTTSPAMGMEVLLCLHVHMWKNYQVDGTTVDVMLDHYTKAFKNQFNRNLNS